MKTVAIVGSTGSIGTQALDVVAAAPDEFRVAALAANRSAELLVEQVRAFRPEVVAVVDDEAAAEVEAALPQGVELLRGAGALAEVATRADIVLNAVVGFAGLPVTLAALRSGRTLALANKESLIAGGPVVQRARRESGAEIIPVDSEHCAVHQCLRGQPRQRLARVVLTASGGPFRGRTRDELTGVTVEDALAHPTWRMGPKITVDSATLANKGLELIEAHFLFGLAYDQIEVVVHPASIVHAIARFRDGAALAHLGYPDMRVAISYALTHPDRRPTPVAPLDLAGGVTLEFEAPDLETFPLLALARHAGELGGTYPCIFNAANEVAVSAFLERRLPFLGIAEVVGNTLAAADGAPARDVDELREADRLARLRAEETLAEHELTPA